MDIKLNKYEKYLAEGKIIKLNICGWKRAYTRDFIDVDIKPIADVQADLRGNLPFRSNTVHEILSCATLEHLELGETKRVLREFYRILVKGGKLTVAVPSLDKIARLVLSDNPDFHIINRYLYGGKTDTYDCHKSMYSTKSMVRYIALANFSDIKEVEYEIPMHDSRYMMEIICIKL